MYVQSLLIVAIHGAMLPSNLTRGWLLNLKVSESNDLTWVKDSGAMVEGERQGGTAFSCFFFRRYLFSLCIATFKRDCTGKGSNARSKSMKFAACFLFDMPTAAFAKSIKGISCSVSHTFYNSKMTLSFFGGKKNTEHTSLID